MLSSKADEMPSRFKFLCDVDALEMLAADAVLVTYNENINVENINIAP
jgi:hypothetical protein